MTVRVHRPIALGILESLNSILGEQHPADKVIERVFKQNRKWGSRDRRHFAETVYDCVRWWRRNLFLADIAWPSSDRPEALGEEQLWRLLGLYGSLHEMEFAGAPIVKAPVSPKFPSRAVSASYPDWLDAWMFTQVKEWNSVAGVLNVPAPAFLRANRLKTTPQKVREKLKTLGHTADLIGDDGLVLKERANLFSTEPFQGGHFELQDIHSQRVAPFLKVEPGQRVIDACAGAGGKTLHIAALMQNKGKIIALDVHDRKLEELKKRTKRAGVDIVEPKVIESTKTIKRLEESCDRLLLDVPCTGTGVFRRNPDAKWKLSPEKIETLRALQKDILERYTKMLKPGGYVVYATCSIARAENEDQVAAFLSANSVFKLEEEISLSPLNGGGDGFYAARMLKR